MLFVITGPVGPYFASGSFKPISLLADPSFVRAWPGGIGDCKAGGYVMVSVFLLVLIRIFLYFVTKIYILVTKYRKVQELYNIKYYLILYNSFFVYFLETTHQRYWHREWLRAKAVHNVYGYTKIT